MIFGIIIVGIIYAYLMRAFDILVAFREVNINVSFKNSVKILFLLTQNYLQLIKDKSLNKKEVTNAYLFHFGTLLAFLTAIVENAKLVIEKDEVAIIPAEKHDSILDMVRSSLPILNDRKFNVVC